MEKMRHRRCHAIRVPNHMLVGKEFSKCASDTCRMKLGVCFRPAKPTRVGRLSSLIVSRKTEKRGLIEELVLYREDLSVIWLLPPSRYWDGVNRFAGLSGRRGWLELLHYRRY